MTLQGYSPAQLGGLDTLANQGNDVTKTLLLNMTMSKPCRRGSSRATNKCVSAAIIIKIRNDGMPHSLSLQTTIARNVPHSSGINTAGGVVYHATFSPSSECKCCGFVSTRFILATPIPAWFVPMWQPHAQVPGFSSMSQKADLLSFIAQYWTSTAQSEQLQGTPFVS